MKYLLSLSLFLPILAFSQTITPEQAKDDIGKKETISSKVYGVHETKSGVTFISLGAAYPDETFTVVVFKDDDAKFSYPLESLNGKTIEITGLIKSFKGKPEIIANSEQQIKF